jgi:hypothetical protein
MSAPVQTLTARDDGFHASSSPDDIWWTETAYFGFDLGGDRPLSLAIYPLFRPNMGVCSLAVHLWGNDGVTPWDIPYSRFRWHIPMPKADLTDVSFEGLTYRVLEPLQRYLVAYDDPGRLTMELDFAGIDPIFPSWNQVDASSQTSGKGHFDQDCRVTGEIVLNGERIPIDTFGHRDRSWYSRPDNAPRRSASVSFGVSAREQFLILRPRMVGSEAPLTDGIGGYLVRDGVRGHIVHAERRVTERVETRPTRFEIEATDSLGRTLEATGRSNGAFAFNTSPPIFAWMTQVEWTTTNGGSYLGEDQEAYAFEEIGPLIRQARA